MSATLAGYRRDPESGALILIEPENDRVVVLAARMDALVKDVEDLRRAIDQITQLLSGQEQK